MCLVCVCVCAYLCVCVGVCVLSVCFVCVCVLALCALVCAHKPCAFSPLCNGLQGVDYAIEKLNEGGWVHLFPEGRVNQQGVPLPFKWGAFKGVSKCAPFR